MSRLELKKPIFAALDLEDREDVLNLAKEISPYVGGFKIGPRLSLRYGGEIIRSLSEMAPVFLDSKYYDIPSVTQASVKAAFHQGASFVTVHAMAGAEALIGLAELEKRFNETRFFRVIAVTVLTSYSQESLPPNFCKNPISEQVRSLVHSIQESGLKTVVCSAQELESLVKDFPELDFVTPGIRFQGEDLGDQKRVMEPAMAIKKGAAAIVVGRPIYMADNPKLAAEKFCQALSEGDRG